MARPEYDQFMFNELGNKSNDGTALSDEVNSNATFQEYKTLKQSALTADKTVSSLPNLILDGARSSDAPIKADGGGKTHIDYTMKDGRQAHIEFNEMGDPVKAKLKDREHKTVTDVSYGDKGSAVGQQIEKQDAAGNVSKFKYGQDGKLSAKEVTEVNGTHEKVQYDHGKLMKASADLTDGSRVNQEFKNGAIQKIELQYRGGFKDLYYNDARTGRATVVAPSYSKARLRQLPQ